MSSPQTGYRPRIEKFILSRTIRKARGKHCARLRYIDDDGKKHELLRTAESKSEAKTKLAQLETELLEKGPARLEASKITFRQLAEYSKHLRSPQLLELYLVLHSFDSYTRTLPRAPRTNAAFMYE